MKKYGFLIALVLVFVSTMPAFAQGGGNPTPTPDQVKAICAQLSAQDGIVYTTITHPVYGTFDCTTGMPISAAGFAGGTASATTTSSAMPMVIPPADPSLENKVEGFTIVKTEVVNGWTLYWTDIAMKDRGDGMSYYGWATATYPEWPELVPAEWPTAPNVANPLVSWFRTTSDSPAPDGVEIPDEGERNYCQVLRGEWCTNVVATLHYMEYTGDGEIPGLWKSEPGVGNALSIYNVGETDARFDGVFLQGWRLTGRFWNGNALPYAITGVHGHASANMLNLETVINPQPITNAGANCSDKDGCEQVHNTAIIVSGNAPLLIAVATVSR